MLLETNSKILREHIEEAQLIHFNQKSNKRKKRSKEQDERTSKHSLNIRKITPLTVNQEKVFDEWQRGQNLLLHGLAGTGKSFISLYLAFKEIFSFHNQYKQVLILRSAVPTRDLGFLPGNMKEKARAYEQPYSTICSTLFERGDAYDILKQKHMVEFATTSYIRGNTFTDTIVVVDEIQNMVAGELDTIMTRLGENCRIIFSGDYRQSDLLKKGEREEVHTFMNILKHLDLFSFIEFEIQDIVRSGIVKDYIIAKTKLGFT